MRCFQLLAAGVAAISFVQAAIADDQVRWQPNLEAAQRLAAQTNRLVLVHFWAPWCQPCMQVEREVFSSAQVGQALDAKFVCVKLNVDESPATAKKLGVSKIPTDVILTSSGQLVAQTPSPGNSNQYIAQASRIADGHKRLSESTVAQNHSAVGGATPASATSAGAAAGQGVYSDQRYASYLERSGAGTPGAAGPAGVQGAAPTAEQCNLDYQAALHAQASPPAAQGVAGAQSTQPQPHANQPLMNEFQRYAPGAAPQPGLQVAASAPTQAQPPMQPAVAQQPAPQHTTPGIELPAGCPPVGMEGYCPVTLAESKKWATGGRRWGAIHRGRTYLFTGLEQQQRFLANPDIYSPILSGDDPVAALEGRQAIPGRREHGVFYQKRIYLFSSEASLQRFNQDPNRYAAEVLQAMNPTSVR